jgi:hypothetical protein
MKRKTRLLLAITLMALPSLPIVALGLCAWHDPSDRYWANVYLVWGTVFAALSAVLTALVIRRKEVILPRSFPSAGFVAWACSFPALVLINLTPLCLGQDNGDGRNSFFMCIFLAVLWFAFMTVPVAGGILLLSKLASMIAGGNGKKVVEAGKRPSP